jgi:peptidoglycan/LPS O-acetylase OafA/YrhL
MHHRSDIEALRALAVAVVLVYHAFPTALPGGFLGVDVFFVVSGYLITLLLATEHAKTGHVSWRRFYTRRVRRLGPALAVTIVATLIWGWFTMLPADYAAAARTAAAAALGFANIELGWSLDYFAADAGRNPLGHTWSLGVEEQFYFVWPLLVWWALRRGGRTLRWLGGYLAVVGLFWAIHVHASDPAWAYFRPDARVWELAAGAWLAAHHAYAPPRRSWSWMWCAPAVIVLCASFIGWDTAYAHPGWATVPTILATVFVLHVGATVRAVRVPSACAAPVLFLGRISYALYLVHWPVFVFWTLDLGRAFTRWEGLAAMGVAIGLAWLLHVCVENPIRYGKAPSVFGPLVVVTALAAVSSTAFWVAVKDGFPGRVGADVRAAEVYSHPYHTLSRACHFEATALTKEPCVLASGGVSVDMPTWAVLGDSHATALISGLMEIPGVEPFLALGVSGCPPTLGPETRPNRDCSAFMRFALTQLEQHPTIRAVAIHTRWTYYGMDSVARLTGPSGPLSNEQVFARVAEVADTLQDRGYKVVLVGPVPEHDVHVPKVLAARLWYGDPHPVLGVGRSLVDARHAAFVQWTRSRSEQVVWPWSSLCTATWCSAVSPEGRPLYFDDDHLTVLGAVPMASELWEVVRPLLR